MEIQTSTERYMTIAKRDQLVKSLYDPEYRRALADDIGTGIAFQIRRLREDRGWTQGELAQQTSKRQETISQWENPNYGSYTLNTLKDLAGAFDVALVVRFAPFSELIEWTTNLSPGRLAPPSFEAQFGFNAVVVASPSGVATDGDEYLSAAEHSKHSLAATQAVEEEFEFAITELSTGENQYAKAA